MKRKPQLFTVVNTRNVPGSPTIVDALERDELQESLLCEYIREQLIIYSRMGDENG